MPPFVWWVLVYLCFFFFFVYEMYNSFRCLDGTCMHLFEFLVLCCFCSVFISVYFFVLIYAWVLIYEGLTVNVAPKYIIIIFCCGTLLARWYRDPGLVCRL